MSIHGVFFDPGTSGIGTNYRMSGNFTGITDTPTGTLSFWFRGLNPFTSTEDGFFDILFGFQASTGVFWQASVNFTFAESFVNRSFQISSQNGTFFIRAEEGPVSGSFTEVGILDDAFVWVQDGLWHHVLVAWDFDHALGARIYKLTVDRWSVPYCYPNAGERGGAFSSTFSAYDTWNIGFEGADIAELWFAPGQFLDVSDPTVIDKFVDSDGNPVDLGTDGSTPTGTKPILYLSLRTATATDWLTNRGSGAGTWTLHQGPAIIVSDTDPVIQNPIRQISGTSDTVELRSTGFSGLDPTQMTLILNTHGSAVSGAVGPIGFDFATELLPTEATIVTLQDNGVGYTTASITPSVAGVGGTQAIGRGADTVYFSEVDFSGDTPAQDFALMSLTTGTVTGPFTISNTSWMTDEFTNNRFFVTPATMIWWDGKEQCVGLFDSIGSGQACMTDASGTVTTAKIWGGWNDWDSEETLDDRKELFLVCAPDPVTGHNHFLTSLNFNFNGYQNNAASHITSDSTGTDLSRALLRADDPIADSLIQSFFYPFGPFSNGLQPAVNAQGFHFTGVGGTTAVGLQVAPDGMSYQKHTFTADPTDRTATIILNSVGDATFVDDGVRKWLLANSSTFSDVNFSGSPALLQDLTDVATNSLNMLPLTQIDTTTSGIIAPSNIGWITEGAGSTSYTPSTTPIDPDYAAFFTVVAVGVTGVMPPDGQSMFTISRADLSGNGYKTAITTSGGAYHLQFQVMPGPVTDIPLTGISQYVVITFMVGTNIKVFVYDQEAGMDLASDGTWVAAPLGGLGFPNFFSTNAYAIDITDATYTDAGRIIFGGVGT